MTSPTSQISFQSFLSAFLPKSLTPDASLGEHSGSIDSQENALAVRSQASTSSSIQSSGEWLSRSGTPDIVAHRLLQSECASPEACTSPVDRQSIELAPLRTTTSTSTAYFSTPPTYPLTTEALPGSCVVESYCMMDEEVEQSAASFNGAPDTAAHELPPQPPAPSKAELLTSAVREELAGVTCGCNTSPAIREQVPEEFLEQLIGLMGAAPEIQTAQAEGVIAAVGPGRLCGSSKHAEGRVFQHAHVTADPETGLTFMCEKRPLRSHLHMYRTRFRIPDASIDTLQTFMLNDHVIRNSNPSMLSYVRLEDPSLEADSGPNMPAALHAGQDLATDSGFTYSKINFPVINARQYCTARRVWHRPAGEGFYNINVQCKLPEFTSQAMALDDAKGLLADKHWSTSFFTAQVVRCAPLLPTCFVMPCHELVNEFALFAEH